MIITDLIREQAVQCAVMFGAGVAVAVLYQIYKKAVVKLRITGPAAAAAEIMFWIAAALMTYRFLYYCAYGALSFHSAAAFTAGALLWKTFFYDIID